VAPISSILSIPNYSNSETYAVNDVVLYTSNNKIYRCHTATTAGIVPTNTNYWSEVTVASIIDKSLSFEGAAADAKATGDLKSAIEQENLAAGLTWTLGKRISGSNGAIQDNNSYAISNSIPVKKAWIKRNTPAKDSSNNAFYVHIHKYKNGIWKSYSSLSYGNSIEITETDDIDSIIIGFGYSLSSGIILTQQTIDNYFDVDLFSSVYSTQAVDNFLKSINDTLENNYLTKISANETYAASKSNLLSNISEPVIFTVNGNMWNDSPINGWFINLPYTNNYSLQVIGRTDDSKMFQRIVNRNNGSVYTNWGIIYVAQPMKILALGDSICYGYRNNYKGFVGDLGYDYKNIGVSGATISNVRTDRTNIVDQLLAETEYQPDIIIAEGGINDWTFGAKLGTVPDTPITTDTEADAILAKESGVQTVMEAMSVLFYEMIKKYPTAQRFFLIVHKIKKASSGTYCPTTKNIGRGGDFTQQELHDVQVAICNLYNVKVIDIYNDGMLNSIFSQYVSPNGNFIDDDGVHPLPLGYTECYLPIVREAIMTGTKK